MRDMLGRSGAVSVARALHILNSLALSPLSSQEVPIEDGYGRILATDIQSPENMPMFARSAMDGYAVGAVDTFGASETLPVSLRLKAEAVAMGGMPAFTLSIGEAAAIPTGGMLPEGADAVVMVEHTRQAGKYLLEVTKAVVPGENVITAGEDARQGETILAKGHRLRPQDIGALAGLGITSVAVFRQPLVALISTGDEIVPAGCTPAFGQVRDINSYNLFGLVQAAGGIPKKMGIYRDDYHTIKDAVKHSLESAHIVLISGGSSVGARDHTARVINDAGEPGVLFHGVAVKPGKPLIAAMVGGIPVFGLPGPPAAVTVSFDLFVKEVLYRLAGRRVRPLTPVVEARLARSLSSAPGREDHVRVRLEERDGQWWAVPIPAKSGLITTLVKAEGTIVVGVDKRGIDEGDMVFVTLFD